jgi:hypothetical protein
METIRLFIQIVNVTDDEIEIEGKYFHDDSKHELKISATIFIQMREEFEINGSSICFSCHCKLRYHIYQNQTKGEESRTRFGMLKETDFHDEYRRRNTESSLTISGSMDGTRNGSNRN